MNDQPTHILTKMGVLSSFSISKKLTEKEFAKLTKQFYSHANTEQEVLTAIKNKIMKEIIDATRNGSLPGILMEENITSVVPAHLITPLNNMVLLLSKKLKSKKINKLSLCYFISALVNNLGLVEEDFEEFYRRFRESQDEPPDE